MKSHESVMRFRSMPAILALSLLIAVGCDYARMTDDEAIDDYHMTMPLMPEGTVPVEGGYLFLKNEDPAKLANPLPYSDKTVAEGKKRYKYFCIQCHGPEAEGFGTVGQSFAPLPANLKALEVRRQDDGALFYKIEMGFRRHPPLAYTMAEWECWSIINYLRFLQKTEPGQGEPPQESGS